MKNGSLESSKLKVVIVGAENSGKTTLVRQLNPNAKSVEHIDDEGNSITVGLDIGKIELAGFNLYFFGTPGHQRFEFARKIVSHGAHIGILMIDSLASTSNEIRKREKDLERELIEGNIPYVICANKRDIPNVLPLSDIQGYFDADVYPISAKNGHGVDVLRDTLVRLIESNRPVWFPSSSEELVCA